MKNEIKFDIYFVMKQEAVILELINYMKGKYGEDSQEYKNFVEEKLEQIEWLHKMLALNESIEASRLAEKIMIGVAAGLLALMVAIPFIFS